MARPAMTPAREGFSITSELSEFTEDQLLRLFQARPDLASPAPRDLSVVGTRAASWASINLCMITLNRACLQLLDALCLLPQPTTIASLIRLLGVGTHVDVDLDDLDVALRRLSELLLVARHGEHVRVHPQIAALSHPAGLGPPARGLLEAQTTTTLTTMGRNLGIDPGRTKAMMVASMATALADPDRVLAALRGAPAGTADLAAQLSHRPAASVPSGTYNLRSTSPVGWLAERGLVLATDWATVTMPREVGLALRGGHPFPGFSLRPPDIGWRPVDPALVEKLSTEHALRLVADMATILDSWQDAPPKLLKAGGIGIRDVRRAAAAIGRAEVDTARVIEFAAVAGLAGWDAAAGVALPRREYDDWLGLDVADRWVSVAVSWLATRLHVNLAGAIGTNEKPIPPLLDRPMEDPARHRRILVLAALSEGDRDHAAGVDTLAARVTWDAPPIWTGGPAAPHTMITWVREEAEMLGICADGALSRLGRAVVTGDVDQAIAILGAHTPKITSEFVIQADLTAVATGPLTAAVRRDLELMADLESSGAATVYRFHEPSLRRAYDAGWSDLEIVGFLDTHATKGVPQPLVYLVDDVGRRHGRVRVGSATCYLRSDEPSLLTEILLARRTAKLGLRQLAPTVLVSAADPETVVATLRANGYLPGLEDGTGDLVIRRQEVGRAGGGHGPSPRDRLTATPMQPATLAAAMAADLAQIAGGGGLAAYDSVAAGGEAPDRAHRQAELESLVRQLRAPRPAPVSGPRAVTPVEPPSPLSTGQLTLLHGDRERPREIAKSPDLIRQLLELSLESQWWLRLAYTNKRGQTQQLNVAVIDIDDAQVDVGTIPGADVRTLTIDRIVWARAMTLAEEEAL
jgi:Helicase conserved C-terminal domain